MKWAVAMRFQSDSRGGCGALNQQSVCPIVNPAACCEVFSCKIKFDCELCCGL